MDSNNNLPKLIESKKLRCISQNFQINTIKHVVGSIEMKNDLSNLPSNHTKLVFQNLVVRDFFNNGVRNAIKLVNVVKIMLVWDGEFNQIPNCC